MKQKVRMFHLGTIILMSITLVSCIALFIYQIAVSLNQVNFWEGMILSLFLLIVYLAVIALGMRFLDKKSEILVIFVSVLFLIFLFYQFLIHLGFIKLPTTVVMEDFYGKNITEVVSWASSHGLFVEQVYEHSDEVEAYLILRQDPPYGTLLKDLKKIKVVVSDGPDDEVITEIPDMVGWNLDQALAFIEENFLTNVEFIYEFSNQPRETIIKQSVESSEIKRNEEMCLTVSLGLASEVVEARMEDLVGKSLKEAEIFFQRNRLSYEVFYTYQEGVEKGTVLSQSVDKGFLVRSSDTKKISITVSEKDKITVPDMKNMSASEITNWATNNKLKVFFEEEYDDSIAKGKMISSSVSKGEVLKPETEIKIVLSKGKLIMISFTTIDDFRRWADENGVIYKIDYQFSDKVASGKLISSSHQTGQVIKNQESVHLVISQGGNTTVPNFLGKKKIDAEKLCKEHHLSCEFVSSSSNEETDTVIKQSMRSGSVVPSNTSITITLSRGN